MSDTKKCFVAVADASCELIFNLQEIVGSNQIKPKSLVNMYNIVSLVLICQRLCGTKNPLWTDPSGRIGDFSNMSNMMTRPNLTDSIFSFKFLMNLFLFSTDVMTAQGGIIYR